uniref:Uncharacterized protein n=1 Tax=Gossypium raimondii TaxID=29730 RepID=A0A0D2TNT6_GOSRA|nr:hypothetical protein B456_009G128600 [Gossypium raimondii]
MNELPKFLKRMEIKYLLTYPNPNQIILSHFIKQIQTNRIKSFKCHHERVVKSFLNHLEIKSIPINPDQIIKEPIKENPIIVPFH